MKRQRGFTLIELITVIGVISLLVAIAIPIAGKVMNSAKKTKASNKLRQIALGYSMTTQSGIGSHKILQANDIYQFAAELAKQSAVRDPQLWILAEDPLVQNHTGTSPINIIYRESERSQWKLDEEFSSFPLSFTVANGIPANADASSTPIAWTRGLKEDGTWASFEEENPGIYGSEGGFIAFLDGHVEWHTDLKEDGGKLRDFLTKQRTFEIKKAVGPRTRILDSFNSIYY